PLAAPRCHPPVPHLRIHPGELDSGRTTGEKTIFIRMNPVPGSPGVALEDRLSRPIEEAKIRRRNSLPGLGHTLAEFVNRDDVPERSIHRIELGLVTRLEETVGQH